MRQETFMREVYPVLRHADIKRWRVPDDEGTSEMIWYGPGGQDGEHATRIGWGSSGYDVSEYTYVRDLIEDPDDDFTRQTVHVSFDELAAVIEHEETRRSFKAERLAAVLRDDPERFARLAVSYGVAKIRCWGGEEEFVEALP